MRRLIVLLAVLTALPVSAQVYRWVDKDGVVHYGDRPPTPGAKPAELPPLQTFSAQGNGAAEESAPDTAAAPKPAGKAAQNGFRPVIVAPRAEETIREAGNKITIAVAALPDDLGLVYYYDGAAQNSTPTPSTDWLVNDVERGTHEVAAAAVDANGNEVARSAAVTFYYKPPTVPLATQNPKPPTNKPTTPKP